MSLSAITSSSAPSGVTSASTAGSSAVARTSNAALAAQATSLSSRAGIVATLGGGSTSSVALYDPAGMLNSIVRAGTLTDGIAVPAAGTDAQTLVQNLLDSGITGSLGSTGDAVASGIYTGTGATAGVATGADWAGILKGNPGAASTVIAASFASGIINTIA